MSLAKTAVDTLWCIAVFAVKTLAALLKVAAVVVIATVTLAVGYAVYITVTLLSFNAAYRARYVNENGDETNTEFSVSGPSSD